MPHAEKLLPQVAYKALWNSQRFVQVDRFFPSTNLCLECGYKNDELSCSDRECPGCRTHHLRDVRAEGLGIVAEGHPETGTPVDCESVWRKPAFSVEAGKPSPTFRRGSVNRLP